MDILDIVLSSDTIVAEPDQELIVGDVQVNATEPFTGWLQLLEDAGGRFVLRDNRLDTTRSGAGTPGDYTVRILASTQSGGPDEVDEGVSLEKDVVVHVRAPFQTLTAISLDTPSFIANGFERRVATLQVGVNTGTLGNRSTDNSSTAWLEMRQSPDVNDFEIRSPEEPAGPRNNELWVRRGVRTARNYSLQLRAHWSGALNSPFRQALTIAATAPPPGDLLSLFGNVVPPVTDSDDPNAIEVGVQFTPQRNGGVIGLRFYKSAANVGPHFGHLWDGEGNLLATANFINPITEGWYQRMLGGTPVMLTAGQSYVASYHTPSGHYAEASEFFRQPHLDFTGWLVAPASQMLSRGNGVFTYSATPGAFPVNTFRATNYYVDIVFLPSPL
ncbi:MAG: DUF4082 domain-containing protein [Alphaproteobacteria bacterium]|nr:DUF4082 domain-containing protein [Alphaproteobacteria bacterium]